MNKRELDLLEKSFAAEIDGALSHHSLPFQTRSKLALKLESEGYLVKDSVVLGGRFPVRIDGYRLTALGHLTYCMSDRCADEPDNEDLTSAAPRGK